MSRNFLEGVSDDFEKVGLVFVITSLQNYHDY